MGHGDIPYTDVSQKILPTVVEALLNERVMMVACGVYHTAIITE